MGVGILLDVSSSFAGLAMGLLLRPLGRLSVFEATRAVYTGLFVNEIVPLKIRGRQGTLGRASTKNRLTKVYQRFW